MKEVTEGMVIFVMIRVLKVTIHAPNAQKVKFAESGRAENVWANLNSKEETFRRNKRIEELGVFLAATFKSPEMQDPSKSL